MNSKNILLTGGAGYIASSIAYLLLENGYKVFIVDNFCNSDERNIKNLPNKENLKIFKIDCCDINLLEDIFINNSIDTIIHLAGLKSIPESIILPNYYYRKNLISTINLLDLVQKYNVKRFIFSSSATVYGNSLSPLTEESTVGKGITNAYGKSKYFNEQIIYDFSRVCKSEFIILRYFNPVETMRNGAVIENPKDTPNNLIPNIIKNYLNNDTLKIFGNNYNTPDGTAQRDYIHIEDLANGHLKAIEYIMTRDNYDVFNLGTGRPYSVLDMIKTFERVNDVKINYEFVDKRAGDLETVYCNPEKANKLLCWKAEKSLDEMCTILKYIKY